MMRIIRLSLFAAATTALVACGGGPKLGGGKEGAAKALFETNQASNKGLQRVTQAVPTRELASAAASGIGEVTLACAQSGKVTLRIDFNVLLQNQNQPGSAKLNYEVEFDDCLEEGVNKLDGKLAVELSAAIGEVSLKFKGKVHIDGEVDDYIDADVTLLVSATGLDQSSGSVTLKLTGTIETSEATYTYDGTPLSISVEGGLPVADEGKP